jgi:hypothetical protein
MSNWFKKLVGFEEENPNQVRENLILKDGKLSSKVNGAIYEIGELEIPTLNQLRSRVKTINQEKNKVKEVIGDIQLFHVFPENNGSLIQAASQFNLLEMVNPEITPEQGIGRYEYDKTQGPACAIACGAGTIYRNYLVEVNGQIGQNRDNQIDCLSEIGNYFKNSEKEYWKMQNGYAFVNESGLEEIGRQIEEMGNNEYEDLKGLLKVGIQKETEVTIIDRLQKVTQIYCSALPVGYSITDSIKWERFARLILDGLYESTILSAIENREKTGNKKVFLTLVGGGVFGNEPKWIIESVVKNLKKYESSGLEINFVSYGQSNKTVRKIIEILN